MLATENYRQRQRNFIATKTLLGKRGARDPGATRNEKIGYPLERRCAMRKAAFVYDPFATNEWSQEESFWILPSSGK
jgi:hypothetical protein